MVRSKKIRVAPEFESVANGMKEELERVFGRRVTMPEVTKLIAQRQEQTLDSFVLLQKKKKKELQGFRINFSIPSP